MWALSKHILLIYKHTLFQVPHLEEDVCSCCRQNVIKTKFKTNGIEQALIIHPNC